jgi:asparagine synthase (glutamine-hydrolysing)
VCGIAGIHSLRSTIVEAEPIRRMLAPIQHRGPDAEGLFLDSNTGLGHVRLSILDLAGGQQPMSNEDGTLWITFNGEIFNYIELRQRLLARGHHFATQCDTEVILHLYEEHGEDCVHHLNGQWAFAIWDRRESKLFLSRDRLGIRPLYYTVAADRFVFASEVKSLFTLPEVPRRLDLVGLDQLFTFWCPVPPRTIFEGISELPPAHSLTVSRGKLHLRRYWQLDYGTWLESLSVDQCAEKLLELLLDSTQLRLRSDVPVGAYLSGGLDSAVTTALARQCTSADLKTFSITFDRPEFDESQHQRRVVDHLGTEHQSVHCRTTDIGRVFPEVIWHTERPILRTAPAPLFLLSQLVRQQSYKVVLTGEGSDEILGGYDIFKEAKIRRFWASQPDAEMRAALIGKLYPYLPQMQAQSPAYRKAFFHVRPEDLVNPLFSHLPRWELTSRLKLFFSDALKAELSDRNVYDDIQPLLPEAYSAWKPFCQAQHLETSLLLPGYILSSQGDRMAMAHSVEGRFPFLDYRLAEFAAQLPPRWKMHGINEKFLLKRATRHLLPASVVERSKQPYRAPDAECFFASGARRDALDYVDALLSPERVRADGVFQPEAVAQLVEKFRSGRAIGVKDNMALVGILSTQILVDRFINHAPPTTCDLVDEPTTTVTTPWTGADRAPTAQELPYSVG